MEAGIVITTLLGRLLLLTARSFPRSVTFSSRQLVLASPHAAQQKRIVRLAALRWVLPSAALSDPSGLVQARSLAASLALLVPAQELLVGDVAGATVGAFTEPDTVDFGRPLWEQYRRVGGTLPAKTTDRGLVITLDQILFQFDEAEIG